MGGIWNIVGEQTDLKNEKVTLASRYLVEILNEIL